MPPNVAAGALAGGEEQQLDEVSPEVVEPHLRLFLRAASRQIHFVGGGERKTSLFGLLEPK
jgi:hypothetical protein